MNDLMTKSFLSYVDLKKQASKDLEARPDIEMGRQQLEPEDSKNLSKFFDEVNAIKADMEEINYLQVDLRDLHESTKSAKSPKILRGLRDRINSDMVMVLRKAKLIKTKLEALDESNAANCAKYEQGSHVDRTRTTVTNGLRVKLRDMMNEFQSLRQKIVDDDDCVYEENREAVSAIQRSLVELHKVFLDMAVMVEVQGEKTNDIEANVANAGRCVDGAAGELGRPGRMRKWRKGWACWVGVVVLVFLLVCLVAVLF